MGVYRRTKTNLNNKFLMIDTILQFADVNLRKDINMGKHEEPLV